MMWKVCGKKIPVSKEKWSKHIFKKSYLCGKYQNLSEKSPKEHAGNVRTFFERIRE